MPSATRRSAVFPPELTADRRRFLALLREKSYERRKVVLSSGRESDFYIAQKSRPVRTAPSASSVLCLQSM